MRLADGGRWDLPGGRVDNVEAKAPLKRILAREVREELGPRIRYKVGGPVFQFRRLPGTAKQNFLTVYEGKYLSGGIRLSFEHKSYAWIEAGRIPSMKKDFSSTEEYKEFEEYFKSRHHARH